MDIPFHSHQFYYPLDHLGFLCPPVSDPEKISGKNQVILAETLVQCTLHFGASLLSIYFRGSQLISSNYNDFDMVIIVTQGYFGNTSDDAVKLNSILCRKFLHIKHFDMLIIQENQIEQSRELQFIIQVLSLRVYGKPLERNFSRFKPDKEIQFILPALDSKMQRVKNAVELNHFQLNISLVNYTVKFLIRAALELTVEKERKYTRDLILCQAMFSRCYPEHSHLSSKILSRYNKANNDAESFLLESVAFKNILYKEYTKN